MNLDISGARVFYTLPIDFPVLGKLQISETLVVSWIVMILITGLCIWLTHDLKVENISKRQALAEMLVEQANKFVVGNMGEKFRHIIPFVAALFVTSVVSKSDQSYRTSKSYGRSFHGGSLGSCGIYHDHCTKDQDRRLWRISERLYHPDRHYDAL